VRKGTETYSSEGKGGRPLYKDEKLKKDEFEKWSIKNRKLKTGLDGFNELLTKLSHRNGPKEAGQS